MAFVRVKRIKGREYAYLVESRWDPKRKSARQATIKYLGPAGKVAIDDVPARYRTERIRAFFQKQAMRDSGRRSHEVSRLRKRLLRVVLDGDRDAAANVLNEGLIALELDGLYVDVVAPTMRAVGDLWEEGAIPVSQEHLATNVMDQHLAQLNAAIRITRPPIGTAALCTPPGEEHSLAVRLLEGLLARRRFRTLNVSASAPQDSIVGFLAARDPDFVLVSVTTKESLPSAGRLVRAVRRELPRARILVGGQAVAHAQAKQFPSATIVPPDRTTAELDRVRGPLGTSSEVGSLP